MAAGLTDAALASGKGAVRIMLFVGGPSTEGQGQVVGKELHEPIRSHKVPRTHSAHLACHSCHPVRPGRMHSAAHPTSRLTGKLRGCRRCVLRHKYQGAAAVPLKPCERTSKLMFFTDISCSVGTVGK